MNDLDPSAVRCPAAGYTVRAILRCDGVAIQLEAANILSQR